jgi:hypothetical protein
VPQTFLSAQSNLPKASTKYAEKYINAPQRRGRISQMRICFAMVAKEKIMKVISG